jgi:hypothetical protein
MREVAERQDLGSVASEQVRQIHGDPCRLPAHPGGIVAGVDDRERLDRLPGMCSKEPMRLLTTSRIRTWLLVGAERLWSQLTPRRQASEIAAVAADAMRSRLELVLENALLRHHVNVCAAAASDQSCT